MLLVSFSHDRPFGSAEMTLGEAFSLQQTGGANVFASFTSFLDKDAIAAVLKEGGVDVVRDTNFISNFERDVISTKFHAVSPIESFAVQLQGRKLWLFMEPAVSDSCGGLSTAVCSL